MPVEQPRFLEDLGGPTRYHKGGFRGQYIDNESATFSKCWFRHVFVVFDTFIKTNGFESLTENDATVCAKLFGPTTDFVYGVKVCF